MIFSVCACVTSPIPLALTRSRTCHFVRTSCLCTDNWYTDCYAIDASCAQTSKLCMNIRAMCQPITAAANHSANETVSLFLPHFHSHTHIPRFECDFAFRYFAWSWRLRFYVIQRPLIANASERISELRRIAPYTRCAFARINLTVLWLMAVTFKKKKKNVFRTLSIDSCGLCTREECKQCIASHAHATLQLEVRDAYDVDSNGVVICCRLYWCMPSENICNCIGSLCDPDSGQLP